MTGVEILLHAWSIAHGIGASLLCAACFFVAGALLIPRRWDESLGSGESPAIAGAALYVTACWFAVELGVPVARTAIGFALAVVALAVLRGRWLLSALKVRGALSPSARRWWLGYCVLYVLAYLFTMPPVTSAHLPIAWTGNVDLLTYLRYTKYFWNLGQSNVAGFDYLNFVYLQTPGVFYLLGWLSVPFGADPLSAAMPAQFAFTALIGLFAARISASVFKLSHPVAVSIGGILISGPFFRYVANSYFLSTLMATPVLLYLLWTTVEDRSPRLLNVPPAIRFGSAYLLLVFIYPFLFFAGVAAQMGAIILILIAEGTSGRVRPGWRASFGNAGRTIGAMVVSLGLLVLLLRERLSWSIDMTRSLSEKGIAGWPLDIISPLAMLALPGPVLGRNRCAGCPGVEVGTLLYRPWAMAAFCGVAVALGFGYLWRLRRQTTPAQRALAGLAAGSLIVYCGYFFLTGPSYQQWKFASYSVLPLSFVVFAGGVHAIHRSAAFAGVTRTAAGRRLMAVGTSAVVAALVGGNLLVHALNDPILLRFPGTLRNIEQVDNNTSFREMTLRMDEPPSAFQTWLALYFLPSKRVHVVSEMFSPNEPLDLEQISRARPLLIQGYSCDGIGHDETMTVEGVGCLVLAPPSLVAETKYPFNRSFMFVEFDAMTAREAGGRWNTRPTLSLTLTADPRRVALASVAYVNFLIQPFLQAGTKPQRLVFSWGSERHGETLIGDRGWVSLPVSPADWDGEWLRTLPISIRFPDGRTLLFQELSITAAPLGRVASPAAGVPN